ncbi:hypothetical protein [Streptomyces sp. V4I2]|uniref:hypothetical protein n=1 Tax=Streptomyces sp. V4I2 TaxID=3042280 RepID=UPI0027890845|nr:hypothetical protein [Streptomyces sp. V4I2]MDQ1047322.1 hypothetical protein [Streptomyces sp. V4I2]
MTGRSKVLMWTGIGLCVAGAAGLVAGGVLDVDAADPWASVAGGAAGLVGLALTIYAVFSGGSGSPHASVTVSGARSVAAGGSIGAVATGDGVQAVAPTAVPGSAPPAGGRPVTASGERSVAAGGDIGSVSTGDA